MRDPQPSDVLEVVFSLAGATIQNASIIAEMTGNQKPPPTSAPGWALPLLNTAGGRFGPAPEGLAPPPQLDPQIPTKTLNSGMDGWMME